MKINGKKLKNILEDHRLWLDGSGGERADLSYAKLRGIDLSYEDLKGANLKHSDIRSAFLQGVDLRGADLRYSNMRSAFLKNADLSGASMRDVDLSNSALNNSDLGGTDLTNVNFRNSCLTFANLTNATLKGVRGNSKEIKSLHISDTLSIAYTATNIQIGCANYKINDWLGINDYNSKINDDEAVEHWDQWGDVIMMIIKKAPAHLSSRGGVGNVYKF